MLVLLLLLLFLISYLVLLIRDRICNKCKNLLMSVLVMNGFRKLDNNTSIIFEKNSIYISFVRDSVIIVISKGAKTMHICTIFVSVKELILEKYNV